MMLNPQRETLLLANMKLFVTFVVLGVSLSSCNPVNDVKQYKTVDDVFLGKQFKVLTLFKHVEQPSAYEEHVQICHNVNDPIQWLQVNKGSFEHPEVVDTMINFFHYDYLLPKGHPFSVTYHQHLEQAIAVFKLMYYAKDFQTFYQTAVVMKKFINEGMFLYSTSVAVVHRKDCYGIILPSIYEIYPWYFFNTETIQEAYKLKMTHGDIQKTVNNHDYHVYANYSGSYLNLHWEQSLSYFMEDVGINAYFYYYHIHYPSWMDGEEFHLKNDYRGEIFLAMLQSLAARYYLERLSHGEGQICHIEWDAPFETPYYPSLQYPSGLHFPERPKNIHLDQVHNCGDNVDPHFAHSYMHVKNFEKRVMDAIDGGVVFDLKENKMVDIYKHENHNEDVNTFGNLIQCNPDSPNPKYYKNYSTAIVHLLNGYSPLTWQKGVPSALEHSETAMRDPAFYQIIKKMLFFYNEYQNNHMVPYHKHELVFPGVIIEKVEMDRLITYFDHFYSDLSNAVWDTTDELMNEEKFQIWAIQKRMNHKPFTYKIHVTSNQETPSVVKVFIGPKYDEYGRHINITENRWNFVPIDTFKWHLKAGQNVIKRSSQESQFYSQDKTTYRDLYKKVMNALKGHGEFHVTGKENYFYFPDRMMLPMGSYSGTPYQFYFIVHPYKPYTGQKEEMTYFYPHPGTGGGYVDDHPIYYPLDKPIKFEKMFVQEVPNSYFYETKVYHRSVDEAQMPVTTHQH